MGFQTTQAQEELRKRVREFAEKEVKPIAFQLDQENKFPRQIVNRMSELGLMGLPYEKKYGGAEEGVIAYAIAVEELSRVDGGVGVILSAHTSLGTYPIAAYGTEEQKQKYLIPLAKGEKLGAFGLTEPNAGSDAGGTETTAEDKGDYYLLNGNKIFITNGGEADTYVVFAVTTPGIGTHGISAFIVEKGWEGFTFGDHYDKLGIRSSATCELIFHDVHVPKENLLGKLGKGFNIAMATLDGGRIGIAAQALGIAQGSFEAAAQYATERIQFGAPIASLQGVNFKIADMATQIRAARYLVYSAAEMKENHEVYGKEAAMAKLFASDTAIKVAEEAVQIFGGNGYLKGMDVERMYRDAKITQIYEGTNEIQKVVIASYILGKAARAPKAEARASKNSHQTETGNRKLIMLNEGSAEDKVNQLVEHLKADKIDFSIGIPMDTPITEAFRVVSAGLGIGEKKNMKLIEDLAKAAGAAVGSSRPVAEFAGYVPLDRYVGMSGQKFKGELYIACGISGAPQHLKGIKNASIIVAINNDAHAKIFKNCDYGIVGDVMEILPLLTKALQTEDRKMLTPEEANKVKVKAPKPYHDPGPEIRYVCTGCGYEYNSDLGDPSNDIEPGTDFEKIPEDWVCPHCGEPKSNFIKTET